MRAKQPGQQAGQATDGQHVKMCKEYSEARKLLIMTAHATDL